MSSFWQVFHYYQGPLRGLFYMPARWLIVPFEQIESYLPRNGLVIDVGCGEGVMATLLAIKSSKRRVLGIDVNKNKINLAKKVSSLIPNLTFEQKDAFNKSLPRANGLVLSDFLHHLPFEKHEELISSLSNILNSSGVMVIKEIDLKDGVRSKISRFFDFLFYPTEKVNFVNSDYLANFLTKLGLKVRIVKVKKWFPGSTALFICKKLK